LGAFERDREFPGIEGNRLTANELAGQPLVNPGAALGIGIAAFIKLALCAQ
jgi:hypothetical protein